MENENAKWKGLNLGIGIALLKERKGKERSTFNSFHFISFHFSAEPLIDCTYVRIGTVQYSTANR